MTKYQKRKAAKARKTFIACAAMVSPFVALAVGLTVSVFNPQGTTAKVFEILFNASPF